MKNDIFRILGLVMVIFILSNINLLTSYSSSFAPNSAKYVVTQSDPDLTSEVLTTQLTTDLIASSSTSNLGSSNKPWSNIYGAFGRFTEAITGKISTEGTNQSLFLSPNGIGRVVIGGDSLVVASKSSNPATSRVGQVYFDTTLKEFRGYNGTSWRSLNSANTGSVDFEKDSFQYLSINDGNQTGLDVTGNITVEAWINIESQVSTNELYGIISKSDSLSNDVSYLFVYEDTNGTKDLRFRYSSDGNNVNSIDGAYNVTLDIGVWYHVAVAVNVSTQAFRFYVDGVGHDPTAIGGSSTSIANTNSPVSIGAGNHAQNFFDGLIDDVRVYNRRRTDGEIAADFSRELSGDERGLVGYWKLDGNLLDETDNHNNLTDNNSATFSTERSF